MKELYKLSFLPLLLFVVIFSCPAQEKRIKKPSSIIQLEKNEFSKSTHTIFKKYLHLSDGNTYASLHTKTDKIGFSHETFQQHYKGIPVAFGKARIASQNGQKTTMSGEYYDVREVEVTPKLSNDQALKKAMDHLGGTEYMWQKSTSTKVMGYHKPEGELFILPDLDSKNKDGEVTVYHLAYKFDIYMTKPRVSRGYIYIDAINGAPLFYNAIIKHVGTHANSKKNLKPINTGSDSHTHFEMPALATGNASTRYSGQQDITTRTLNGNYVLRDNTRGNGINTLNSGGTDEYPINDFTDSDNNWTATEYDNAAKDNAALDAHWGAAVTYDYLSDVHGRNSFDNNGGAINSWVHYDEQPGGVGYDNAFWNGSIMSYGDGSSNGDEGNGLIDALTSLDVAAHEIGHAITTYTADLAYQRESGGLNEGFSDIWGAAVEHFAKGNGNDAAPAAEIWLIGEEIDRRNGSSAFRSMSNPKALGQPDTYRGTYWQAATAAEGCSTPIGNGADPNYNDMCGVHSNSGVLNYWFYLTVAGSAATDGVNDNGDTFSVSGIGMSKSANIAYRMLDVYLTANATFMDARNAAIQSAKDLYGASGAEEQAVTNAWYAAGVGAAYGDNSYCSASGNNTSDEFISNVSLSNIDNTSGAGSGGYTDFTDISTNLSPTNNYTITITPTWTGTPYDEGYGVWIDFNQDGDFSDAGEQVLSQSPTKNTTISGSITVPANAVEGNTIMRVSMKYNGTPTSCESFSYGEVEDYTIEIDGETSDNSAPNAPTALTADNITETSLTLSWDEASDNVGVTGYNVYQDDTLLGNISSTTANITGLIADTTYTFKVKALDAAGNQSEFSNTLSVTTATSLISGGCTTGISSFPYNQSFENTLGAWTQSTQDDINWDFTSNSTPSSGTGPESANQGTYYLFVEASGEGAGFPNKQAVLTSPCFDLSEVNTARFKFDYHMYGGDDMGSIAVEASTDQGTNWITLWSESTNQGNSWNNVNIDLDTYLGGGLQLRFNRVTGGSWKADVAIDNISITDSVEIAPTDPCDGVLPYNGNTNYQVGDRVTYNGSLYERTSAGWSNIGACNATNAVVGSHIMPGSIASSTQIRVYPIPVNNGTLNVSIPVPESKKYTIYNMIGQTVAQGTLIKTIDVNPLEAGVYILQIESYPAQRFIVE